MSDNYEGEERRTWNRREHDDVCAQNQKSMKEWVSDKICIATKGSKVRQGVLITLLSGIFLCLITLAYGSITSADEKVIDTLQTADIKHNRERIVDIAEAHKKMVTAQEAIKKDVGDMKGDIREILTILERR